MNLLTPVSNHIVITESNKPMTVSFLPSFISKLNAFRFYLALPWVNHVAESCKESLLLLQKHKQIVVLSGKKKKKKRNSKEEAGP